MPSTRFVIIQEMLATNWAEEQYDSMGLKQRENILSRIPMAKLGSPDNIADACIFLGSEMSDYITGQTIHVNGGMAML